MDDTKKFEKEGFYSIEVNPKKNFIFLKPMGLWKSVEEDIPNYLEHLASALKMVTRGFKMKVNLKEHQPPKLKVTNVLKENQQMILQAGPSKVAVELTEGSLLKKMSLSVVGKLSGLPFKVFDNEGELDLWLQEA